MNLLSSNMDDLADIFIRPSRHLYKNTDLGPKNMVIKGSKVARKDFEIKNNRKLTLKCSYYYREENQQCENFLIYLHCNSGCRVEGLSYLRYVLENQFNYILFDFSGSGMSDGRYISLGFHQAQDLDAVINYVKRHINLNAKFCLWGRSMGAVTALRYLGMNRQTIKMAVFDSPFSSLKKLFLEIGKQRTSFPEILLNVVYKYIRPIIVQKASFDIDQMDLQQIVNNINSPGIFIASKKDSLIPFVQIEDVFNNYKGQKQMYFIEESHNQARNISVINKVFKTIKKSFVLFKQLQLKKQKTSFYGIIPNKEGSRKKLELTIKSYSQRYLKYQQNDEQINNIHADLQINDKNKSSSLLLINKFKKEKKISQNHIPSTHSEPFMETKRKPLSSKNLFREQNCYIFSYDHNIKPKFTGEVKALQINKKLKQKQDFTIQKGRERKTFQNITNKRPPFVLLKGTKQLRSSFDIKYRS